MPSTTTVSGDSAHTPVSRPATTAAATEPPHRPPTSHLPPWWWFVTAGAMALFLGLGLLQGISLFARPLAFFLLGVAIATALAPVANQLARWLPRTLAVIAIYLVLALIMALLGWLVLPSLFNGLQAFGEALPTITTTLQQWLTAQNAVDGATLVETLSTSLTALGPRLLALPVAITAFLVNALLVFFISLYALLVAPSAQDFTLSLLPQTQRSYVQGVIHNMSKAMGGYVRGAFLSGVAVGLLTYLGLLLIEVPFPLVLALIAGVLEIVPILGPVVTGVLVIGVALTQSLEQALFALGFSIVLQQVEGNIIFPNLMSRETEMSPLLSIVAFLAGSAVGGLLGALVAIPLAAAGRVFVVEVVAPLVRRWSGAR